MDVFLEEHSIKPDGVILDPFVGAGTTLLKAKQKGFSAIGVDLSPLSIFVTRAKLLSYDKEILTEALVKLVNDPSEYSTIPEIFPKRLKKAFSEGELCHLLKLQSRIRELEEPAQLFFMVALLSVQQQLSRATPDGGWFRWVEKPNQEHLVYELFQTKVEKYLSELDCETGHAQYAQQEFQVIQQDARNLDSLPKKFDALLTSPPYPNRHDYSRIFHIELLSLGLSEKEIFSLRHESIRSHVEAHSPEIKISTFQNPELLQLKIASLPKDADPRIAPMLTGYFEDMYFCLKSINKVMKTDAPCAFVVGNVRHAGVMIPVDEILAEVGKQAGFKFEKAWVARLRGNSAQQMAKYGREPARETIVIFKKS
ncbi:MAG: site-specific DNA-methyltransferase [Anaerolineales bacterium]